MYLSYDLNVRLTGLLNRIETIDRMLSEDLLEFDAK